MKRRLAGPGLIVSLWVVAGCGGSSKPSPAEPTTSPCVAMASHIGEQVRATVAEDDEDAALTAEAAEAFERVIRARCQADGWSSEAIGCLSSATGEQLDACETHLTQAQQDALERDLEAEMQRVIGGEDEGADALGGG